MATDSPKMLSTDSIEWAGADMTRRAANDVYKKAGITANDVQVIELHDCFSANEVSIVLYIFIIDAFLKNKNKSKHMDGRFILFFVFFISSY